MRCFLSKFRKLTATLALPDSTFAALTTNCLISVKERVKVERANFPLRRLDVLPQKIRQLLGEVVINEGTIFVLEEGRFVLLRRLIEFGHQGLGCRHRVSSKKVQAEGNKEQKK